MSPPNQPKSSFLSFVTMSSLEEISLILAKTATTEVNEASEQLALLRQQPTFFGQLLELLSTDVSETIKKAAVVQMKFSLNEHPELVEQFPLETFCTLFDQSSFEIQNVLEIVSDALVKFISADLESFLSALVPLLQNGLPSGFCLLDSFMPIAETAEENHQIFEALIAHASACIEYIVQTIEANIGSNIFQKNIIRTADILKNVLLFAPSIEPPFIELILNFCFPILSAAPQIPNVNLTTPLLNNLCDVIYFLFRNFKDEGNVPSIEAFSSVPEEIISFLPTVPDNSKANIFNILNLYFSLDPLYAIIEENVDDILSSVILPAFLHNPEKIAQIDPSDAIDLILPNEQEEDTSVGAAAKILRDNAAKLGSNVLQIVSQQDLSTEANVFACLFAVSCVAKQLSEEDIQNLAPFLELAAQCFEARSFSCCSGLVFLAGLPVIDDDSIHQLCMQTIEIIMQTDDKILRYLSIVAVANLLDSCQSQQEAIFSIINENISALIQVVFEMNQEFQTDYMANSVIKFTQFFAPVIHTFADDYVSRLISLFHTFMESDQSEARRNAGLFIAAIESVLKSAVTMPEITGPLTEQLLQYFASTDEDLDDDTFMEEFVTLMKICVQYAPELTELVLSVPGKLNEFVESDESIIEDVAPVIRILLQRFPDSINNESVHAPIANILELILAEEEMVDNYWDGLVYILQGLFVICGASEFSQAFIEQVIEMIGDEREITTKGIATSLITCNPVLSLAHENIALSWLEYHTPAAFLQSAIVVLSNWDSIPDAAKALEPQIRAKIAEAKTLLLSVKVPQEIDPFNFADPSSDDDWVLYNKAEILGNPVLN